MDDGLSCCHWTHSNSYFLFVCVQYLPDLDADEEVAEMTKKKQRELEVDSLSLSPPFPFICIVSPLLHQLARPPSHSVFVSSPPSPSQLDWSRDPCRTSPHRLIPTPDQDEDQPVVLVNAGVPHYNFNNIYTTPVRCAPLPTLW